MILFKPYIHPLAAALLALWAIYCDTSRSQVVPRDWPLRFFHMSLVLMAAISLSEWLKIVPIDIRFFESASLGLTLGLFSMILLSKVMPADHRIFKRLNFKWPLLLAMIFLTANNFVHFQAAVLLYWVFILMGILLFYHRTEFKGCFNLYCIHFCLLTLAHLLSLKPFLALEYFHLLQSLLFVFSLILLTIIYDRIGTYDPTTI